MVTREKHQENLEKIRDGLATKVRILIPADACPRCRVAEGVYALDDARLEDELALPLDGCSRAGGCTAFYAPVLDRFGP